MSNTIFANRRVKNATIPSPSGSKEATEFQMKYNATGTKKLVKSGKTNIYSKIQEAGIASDINMIIKRATLGDDSALNAVQSYYADVTNAPKSLMEMQNMVITAKQQFATLPSEIRQKFGNNIDVFLSEIGSDTFNQKIGIKQNVIEALPEDMNVQMPTTQQPTVQQPEQLVTTK